MFTRHIFPILHYIVLMKLRRSNGLVANYFVLMNDINLNKRVHSHINLLKHQICLLIAAWHWLGGEIRIHELKHGHRNSL